MNVAEAVARDLVRVTKLRQQYEETGRLLNDRVSVAPAIALMDQALELGCVALGYGDAIKTLQAYELLKGFTE